MIMLFIDVFYIIGVFYQYSVGLESFGSNIGPKIDWDHTTLGQRQGEISLQLLTFLNN